MIGKTISHYKVLEKLGAGGMGVVYKAKDTKLKRTVVLKFLPPELTRDEKAKNRFIHEAQAASALEHTNICNIHEINETEDGQLFIVMACYEGQTLKEKIEKGALKIEKAVDIAIQICQGLTKAHEKGIVHRDIKPSNIFIDKEGVVKILDFGLVKLVGRTQLTKTGSTLGTVAYMSPEQAGGDEIDHRTDIWSLGIVLYEMIAGQTPFASDYDQAVIHSILNEEPDPLISARSGIPAELQEILNKALEKRKENRYQSVDRMLIDLKSLKNSTGLIAARLPSIKINRNRIPAKFIFGIASILLLFAVLVIYYLFLYGESKIDSVAVLPFENVSNDPELEYLCDGIADNIINSLSRLPELKVIASNSVRYYKGKEIDIRTVAKDLDVRSIVVGKLLQPEGNLSIRVELVDALNRRQLWGEQYDGEFSEILEIQKEIAWEISEKLRSKLTPEDKKKLTRTYTENTEAYQNYLRGLHQWKKFTIEGFTKAIEHYQMALRKDPNYALAYAGIANSYALLGSYHGNQAPNKIFPRAREAALKAIDLDDSICEAYIALAAIRMFYDWGWKGTEQAFKQAIELNPNSALATQHYGLFLAMMKRTVEAIARQKKALELDPLSYKTNDDLALSYVDLKQYERAIQQLKIAIELGPQLPSAHRSLGLVYFLKGLKKEAIDEFRKAVVLSDSQKRYVGYLGWALGSTGNKDEALQILHDLQKSPGAEGSIALVHIGLGEKEQALNWLEKAYQARSSMMVLIYVDPYYDSLRNEPRFIRLLDKMRFSG